MLSLCDDEMARSDVLKGNKGSMKFEKGIVKTLGVFQTETSIEVTTAEGGRRQNNSFPLDGREGAVISPGGKKGANRRAGDSERLLDLRTATMPP